MDLDPHTLNDLEKLPYGIPLQSRQMLTGWPREQTVGIDIKLNHIAATPPGLTVTVNVKLEEVEGRKYKTK